MASKKHCPCPSCGSELAVYPRNPPFGSPCPFCGYVAGSNDPKCVLSVNRCVLSVNAPIKSAFTVGGYKFCSERGQPNAIAGAYLDGEVLHVTVNWRRVKVAEETLWVDGECYGRGAAEDRIHVANDGSVSINGEPRPPAVSG